MIVDIIQIINFFIMFAHPFYNLLGEEIGELAGKEFSMGVHSVIFNASHLASGI
jgi:hypothetical protein